MCDPVSAAVVIGVGATAFQAYSQVQEGKFKKGVADYNARVMENEAQRTRNVGTEAENAQRQRVALLVSKQRAQLGAAGVELESGSALQLQQDTATLGEADALRIRTTFGDKATSLETGAELKRAEGEAAEKFGYMKAAGTILSGGASVLGTGVADKWFTQNSAGNQTG